MLRGTSYIVIASLHMIIVSLHYWHLQWKTDNKFCMTYDIPLNIA